MANHLVDDPVSYFSTDTAWTVRITIYTLLTELILMESLPERSTNMSTRQDSEGRFREFVP